MKLQSYILAMVLLSAFMVPMSVSTYLAYSSTDDNDDSDDSENQRCYHSGFEAGQGGGYNQTQQSDCGRSGEQYSHAYYQGLYSRLHFIRGRKLFCL